MTSQHKTANHDKLPRQKSSKWCAGQRSQARAYLTINETNVGVLDINQIDSQSKRDRIFQAVTL